MNEISWLGWLSLRDIVDIGLVALVIYNLLLLIRGTRAVQIVYGLAFLAAVAYGAQRLELTTLETLLRAFITLLPIAVIILFQQEIRRGLARFGRNPLLGLGSHEKVESTIQEVGLAASALSETKTGALIVLQRLEGLRNYVEAGIAIDAVVSYDLLVNIFSPDTPLHDGAVVIQDDRIASAASFLPLSLDTRASTKLGTRHRAAIGVTAESDAVAVVVSEETGTISVAVDGQLIRNLDAKGLRNTLYKYLIADIGSTEGQAT